MAQKIKFSKEGATAKVAVIFDNKGGLHSAMLSGNSLWSAGQRIHAAKKSGKGKLSSEATLLHISWQVVERLWQARNAQFGKQIAEQKARLEREIERFL